MKVSDGSDFEGIVHYYGHNIFPNWIIYPQFEETVIFIRMPDGRALAANLWVTRKPTHRCIIAPTSVTASFLDGTSKNAVLEFFDQTDRYDLWHFEDMETRTFVGMSDGLVYTGYFR